MPTKIDRVLTFAEVRELLGVSKGQLSSPDGILASVPVISLGARRRGVRASAVEAWLAARTVQPETKG